MWKIGRETKRVHTPIFDVVWHEKTSPKGVTFDGVSLDTPNWVSAVVYNKDTKKFMLVKEFRHGINDYIYEFPSGTVEEGETATDACIREIKEELGVEEVKIRTVLFSGNPNPAFMHNLQTCFFVEVSGKTEQKLDTNEDVTAVEFSSYNEMIKALKNKPVEYFAISQQLALAKLETEVGLLAL